MTVGCSAISRQDLILPDSTLSGVEGRGWLSVIVSIGSREESKQPITCLLETSLAVSQSLMAKR
jgi:hypothetical protein